MRPGLPPSPYLRTGGDKLESSPVPMSTSLSEFRDTDIGPGFKFVKGDLCSYETSHLELTSLTSFHCFVIRYLVLR